MTEVLTDSISKNRQSPINLEAEQALLGAILNNNEAYDQSAEFLRKEHFAHGVHGRIFEAIGKLLDKGYSVDAVQLYNYFAKDEDLKSVGGAEYLADLQANAISIINVRDYGTVIYDLYVRRQLISLGDQIVNNAFSGDVDFDGTRQIEDAEAKLFNLSENGALDNNVKPFKLALSEALNMAEKAHKRDGAYAGLATGLQDLDKLLGGLHHSDLLILAGRPAMGKTALATNIAFNAAQNENAHVAFFSLEMSADQLATRILSEQAKITSERIRRGELSNDEFNIILKTSRELENTSFYIDDTPALSLPVLRARCRRIKRLYGLDFVVIDYLQLMRTGGKTNSENRVQEISEITRGLKALAKEMNVPILALSQLSRAVESREDKKPQLSDLRESGSIEQDADVVMFVYRQAYYLEKAHPIQKPEESDDAYSGRVQEWASMVDKYRNKALAIVGKQRHGPTGEVTLAFDGSTTKFSNYIGNDYLPESYG